MFEYYKELHRAAQVLDKYDMSEWIEEFYDNGESRDINDFKDFLLEKNNEEIVNALDEFDNEDFSRYIENTYDNIWVHERTIYEMYHRRSGMVTKLR